MSSIDESLNVFVDPEDDRIRHLLESLPRDSDTRTIANEVWKALDSAGSSPDDAQYRIELRRILSQLAITGSDVRSSSFALRDVKYDYTKVAGGFITDVFIGTFQGAKVALKRLPAEDNERTEGLEQILLRELILWKSLAHRYIIPVLGISEDDSLGANRGAGCIVTPWMKNGSLRDYIHSGIPRRISVMNTWLYQILDGLAYLHSESVVHGNLHLAMFSSTMTEMRV